MWEKKFKSVVLALLIIFIRESKSDIGEGTFVITGPTFITEGHDYNFVASTQDLEKNLKANFKLAGYDSENNYHEFNIINADISSDKLENFAFKTRQLSAFLGYNNPYKFSANITDPSTKSSQYFTKDIGIFASLAVPLVQFDKASYKSGDQVKFRIFSVDSETRPFDDHKATFTFCNPTFQCLEVPTFINVTLVNGKFEGSFELGNNPMPGSWRIQGTVGLSVFSKSFDVEDYMLPIYSVNVDVPSQILFADSTFPVTITTASALGKTVEGTAVVKFYKIEYIYEPCPGFREGYTETKTVYLTKTMEINTKSLSFSVDIKNDLGITQVAPYNIYVSVDFTEKVTGKTLSSKDLVSIVPFDNEIIFTDNLNTKQYYAANSTVFLKISMRKQDGSTAPAGTKITVGVSKYCYENSRYCNGYPTFVSSRELLDSTGSFDIQIPTDISTELVVSVKSAMSEPAYYRAYYQRDSVNDLKAKVLTKKPKLGSIVNVEVQSYLPTAKHCFCSLISKGILLKTVTVKFVNQIGTFGFTPNFAYSPTTQIACYLHKLDGSISASNTPLNFENNLPNYLDLELSSETVKAGDNLSLKVGSAVNSTVSLSCIDQKVLLLKSGEGISKTDVLNALQKYNDNSNFFPWQYRGEELLFRQFRFYILKWILPYSRPITPITTTQPTPTTSATTKKPSETEVSEEPDYKPPPALIDNPTSERPAPPAIPPPRIQRNDVETFLWETVRVNQIKKQKGSKIDTNRGEVKVPFTAPDQITSYVCSGVSIHNKYGIGLSEKLPTLKVFKPFFIQANFPHHIKRGEILHQDLIIANYLDKTQNVTLTIQRNNETFELAQPELDGWKVLSDRYERTFTSVSDEPAEFEIVIRAFVLGSITIKIDAVGVYAGDSVDKKLVVIPEGIPNSITQSVLLSKSETNSDITASLICNVPNTAVNDTTSASASVFGDFLGDIASCLTGLIQMSYGCGEQNLLNFVPNIIVMSYLDSIGKLTTDLRARAVGFAFEGYKQQLKYFRSRSMTEGSFSAFGNDDAKGSTWLTAYVIKSFQQAKPYISTDPFVFLQSLSFIRSKQNSDGSFREDGNVIHKELQGGSGTGLALTCYISIIYSENLKEWIRTYDPQLQLARNKSCDYIAANVDLNNIYHLTIGTYALFLANHSALATVAQALWAKRIETADTIHWEKPSDNSEAQNAWWYNTQPRSEDIEVTSYALLYYVNIDLAIAAKIGRYSVEQKNACGGYGSSQDTVVGIRALAAYSAALSAIAGTLKIHLESDRGDVFDPQVDSTNLLTVQKFNLNPLARQLNVSSGVGSKGTAIASLTCNFYIVEKDTAPAFKITHEFVRPCNNKLLRLRVCLTYIARGNDYESNMVLMETRLPSGYIVDSDFPVDPIIRRLDTKDSGTIEEVYIDKITNVTTCFDLQFIQTSTVTNLKPGSLVVWDYYDKTKKVQIIFSVPENLIDCADLPALPATTSAPTSTASCDYIVSYDTGNYDTFDYLPFDYPDTDAPTIESTERPSNFSTVAPTVAPTIAPTVKSTKAT